MRQSKPLESADFLPPPAGSPDASFWAVRDQADGRPSLLLARTKDAPRCELNRWRSSRAHCDARAAGRERRS